jgi:ParB-like chromosome segregation protein Spo0J
VIVPDLQSLAAPIDSIRTMTGNPRRGDVEAVMRSLDKFGQRKPIVVREDTGEVIAGNHTFMAAQRLGWSEIAVVWVQDDDTTAKAFALADNRTSELGGYDDDALAAMIAEVLAEDADMLAAASYTESDLNDLLAATAPVDLDDDLPVPEARQAPVKLMDRFLGLPVTVLSSRSGWWQDRKRAWTELGIESELGRDGKPLTWNLTAPPGSGHGEVDLVRKDRNG